MPTINFTVPGQPVGKGRARIGKVGAHTRMFTPEKTVNYENLVAVCAHQAMGAAGFIPLIEGPVAVTLHIWCQIPASWSARKQQQSSIGAIFPTTKPDIDNVEKAIFDALNGVVWRDDAQVVRVSKQKCYGKTPGVDVRIWALNDPAAPDGHSI